jgi:hypothetical protein
MGEEGASLKNGLLRARDATEDAVYQLGTLESLPDEAWRGGDGSAAAGAAAGARRASADGGPLADNGGAAAKLDADAGADLHEPPPRSCGARLARSLRVSRRCAPRAAVTMARRREKLGRSHISERACKPACTRMAPARVFLFSGAARRGRRLERARTRAPRGPAPLGALFATARAHPSLRPRALSGLPPQRPPAAAGAAAAAAADVLPAGRGQRGGRQAGGRQV